ncbi:MAG: hypothetical protein WA655_02935 [Candidatus Korobacteraceae bacterium]
MKRIAMVIALLLAASAAGNCKGTKLVASVKSPTYNGQRFKKVLVIGMSDNPAIRSDFEDAMASQLKRDGVHAVPGHNILLRPKSAKMDPDYLKAQIKEHNIDAVLVSRLVSVKTDVTYIPGQAYTVPYPYYNSFYGYYGAVYPVVYSPDYLREDKTVRVETNLYGTSTPEGEFVWTGISETFNPNPKKVDKAINAVVQVVVKDLEKEGIF